MITSFQDLLQAIGSLLDLLLPITVAVALLVFLWGLASFIRAGGDTNAIAAGKNLMTWGVVALFVMVSIWGIVGFFQESFFGQRLNIDSGGAGGSGGSSGRDCPTHLQGTSECRFYVALTNEGYYQDGTPCHEALFGTPPCAYDRSGRYQGMWERVR